MVKAIVIGERLWPLAGIATVDDVIIVKAPLVGKYERSCWNGTRLPFTGIIWDSEGLNIGSHGVPKRLERTLLVL